MTASFGLRYLLGGLVVSLALQAHAAAINQKQAVEIGGIQQWISLKGADDRAPVLLFLHGGPGNSVMNYAGKFTSELQKHFVVVQWDQRASGKTASLQITAQTPTVELMVTDAEEMIRYLCKRFSQEKIWLVGHSWGGFLALMVASRNPDLLRACVALSPMIDQVKSERMALDEMMAEAAKEGNATAQSELATVRVPFENATQLYLDRKWMAIFGGRPAPGKSFVLTWGKTWFPLFAEACQINLFEQAAEIRCPVYLCIGKWDIQTHYSVAEAYFKVLKAEKKDLFWFSESGHNLNLTEPAKFQNIVISLIQSKN
jgi:pimeloyl-ACP methyl ester carboxylesterase